jgi:hypothetical protein
MTGGPYFATNARDDGPYFATNARRRPLLRHERTPAVPTSPRTHADGPYFATNARRRTHADGPYFDDERVGDSLF